MQLDNIHPRSPRCHSRSASNPHWFSHCFCGNQSMKGRTREQGRKCPIFSELQAQMSRTQGKKIAPATQAPTYHIRIVVTHVDPLASRKPGLVLKHLLHETQVARINVMEQAEVTEGGLRTSSPTHHLQQRTSRPWPTFPASHHQQQEGKEKRERREEDQGERAKGDAGTPKDTHRQKNTPPPR